MNNIFIFIFLLFLLIYSNCDTNKEGFVDTSASPPVDKQIGNITIKKLEDMIFTMYKTDMIAIRDLYIIAQTLQNKNELEVKYGIASAGSLSFIDKHISIKFNQEDNNATTITFDNIQPDYYNTPDINKSSYLATEADKYNDDMSAEYKVLRCDYNDVTVTCEDDYNPDIPPIEVDSTVAQDPKPTVSPWHQWWKMTHYQGSSNSIQFTDYRQGECSFTDIITCRKTFTPLETEPDTIFQIKPNSFLNGANQHDGGIFVAKGSKGTFVTIHNETKILLLNALDINMGGSSDAGSTIIDINGIQFNGNTIISNDIYFNDQVVITIKPNGDVDIPVKEIFNGYLVRLANYLKIIESVISDIETEKYNAISVNSLRNFDGVSLPKMNKDVSTFFTNFDLFPKSDKKGIEAIEISRGTGVKLFTGANFTGSSKVFTTTTEDRKIKLQGNWSDQDELKRGLCYARVGFGSGNLAIALGLYLTRYAITGEPDPCPKRDYQTWIPGEADDFANNTRSIQLGFHKKFVKILDKYIKADILVTIETFWADPDWK